MNLLFSIDDGYVRQFQVTLYSLIKNSNSRDVQVYVLQKTRLSAHEAISQFCQNLGITYHPVIIGEEAFEIVPKEFGIKIRRFVAFDLTRGEENLISKAVFNLIRTAFSYNVSLEC